jgi:hypothetical protein
MECFCGCGRRAGVRRGFNKNGLRTDGLLRELGSALAAVESESPRAADSDSDPLIGSLRDLIAEGERHRMFWQDAVHGGDWPHGPGRALQAKREWQQWTETTLQITTLLKLPPEEQRAIIDRW